jgi:hypothetical protein
VTKAATRCRREQHERAIPGPAIGEAEVRVTHLINIGKWYDPISQRWILPREAIPATIPPHWSAERGVEVRKKSETQRIWDALVDCCARG